MVKRLGIAVLSGFLALAGSMNLHAQQKDSTGTGKSILDLTMQERYKPYNQPFHKGGLLANTYVTVIGSGYRQFASNYSNGPHLVVGAEKWLSEFHGLRVSGGGGYFFDNVTNTRIKLIDARVSYMFNVSSYVDGYVPMRVVEVLPVAGVGFTFTFAENWKQTAGPSAHLGADFVMRVFPGVDVVVEPLLEVSKDSRELVRMDVWRQYLVGWQLGVGARVALDKERWGADPGKQWFVTAQGGFEWQNSDLERDIAFSTAVSAGGAVAFGRYYGKAYALRLQAGYGNHYWKEIKEGDKDIYQRPLEPARYRSGYAYMRLDGVLDFIHLLVNEESPWSASALFGPEVGVMHKVDPSPDHSDIHYPYVGVSAALQGKWNFWRGLGVYIEPRVSIVPYTADAYQTSTEYRNYYDAVFTVSLGLEYRFGNN